MLKYLYHVARWLDPSKKCALAKQNSNAKIEMDETAWLWYAPVIKKSNLQIRRGLFE